MEKFTTRGSEKNIALDQKLVDISLSKIDEIKEKIQWN